MGSLVYSETERKEQAALHKRGIVAGLHPAIMQFVELMHLGRGRRFKSASDAVDGSSTGT
jgi:hypothetical protein